MRGTPRSAGCWACSTDAKKASMSTSRNMITSPPASIPNTGIPPLRRPHPRPGQRPAWRTRVVAQLEAVAAGALHGKMMEQAGPFTAVPAAGHLHDPVDPAAPTEADGLHTRGGE